MKIKSILVITLMLTCMILPQPVAVQATAPEALTIEATMWLTGENSAEGYFSAEGLFEDGGYASEVLLFADDTIHGTKTLVGEYGTITLKFQAQITWTGESTADVYGRYVIVSGTGAYENLHGVGEAHAALDLGCMGPTCPPNIVANYTGKAHFD